MNKQFKIKYTAHGEPRETTVNATSMAKALLQVVDKYREDVNADLQVYTITRTTTDSK